MEIRPISGSDQIGFFSSGAASSRQMRRIELLNASASPSGDEFDASRERRNPEQSARGEQESLAPAFKRPDGSGILTIYA